MGWVMRSAVNIFRESTPMEGHMQSKDSDGDDAQADGDPQHSTSI